MEQKILDYCCLRVAEKFGKGPAEQWTESTFIELSESILAETKVMISKNTLKRIFKKIAIPDYYSPQKETKNALARYLGYADWGEFADVAIAELGLQTQPKAKTGIAFNSSFLWIGGLLVMLATTVIMWVYFSKSQKENLENIKLEISSSSETVPTNLKIRYQIPSSDSFQLVGPAKVWLNPNDSLLNYSITYPDYYWVAIFSKKRAEVKRPFLAQSDGWRLYHTKIKPLREISEPFFQGLNEGFLDKRWFEGKAIDTASVELSLRKFGQFTASADSIQLSFEAYLQPMPQVCNGLTMKLMGLEKHIEFRLAPHFCQSHIFVILSEKFISGSNTDFSSLDFPLGQWHKVKLSVANKQVNLSINGKPSFSQSYLEDAGHLKGLVFDFMGFGKVKNIKINGLEEKVESGN